MAVISFAIADAQLPRLVAALADRHGVAATGAATKAAVIADWREMVQIYELEQARMAIQPTAPPTIT